MKLLLAFIVMLGAVIGIWLGGVRIIIIQPIGAIPNGVTVVMVGIRGPNLIDSPDAICNRTTGGVSLLCRGMTAAKIADEGRILARLPYSSILFRLSGAPIVDR